MNAIFNGLTGTVVTPCSTEYEEARQGRNLAIQKFPAAIVYCNSTQDVQNAVCWARQHCIGIRIRSGGHNYQGYSNGNGILVIDVSQMNQIELNESDGFVWMQSGVRFQQLYDYLGTRGYPFPGGTCPTVGASGFALGGGWGYSARSMGLGCDNLIALELVNNQGQLLQVDDKHYPDLFWACRGAGGGNFGVVTSMTFRLPPKIEQVTLVEMEHQNALPADMVCFLDTWQKWLVGLDPRMTINANLFNSAEKGMGIHGEGFFYGSAEEAEQLLKPFEAEDMSINLQEMSFLEAIHKIGATHPVTETFQSTSRFVCRQYTIEEIRGIVDLICRRAEGSIDAAINIFAFGGKISEVGKNCTAFYYRNAAYLMGIKTVWEEEQYAAANRCWFYERFQCLKRLTFGSYTNNPYECLQNYNEAYYGGNLRMLQRVAKKYDPMNVFCFPQAIR